MDEKPHRGDKVARLGEKYIDEPLRSLWGLIPFVNVAESFAASTLKKLIEKRKRVFFDELASGKRPLTPDMLDSDEFLHAFFRTSEAAIRTHREEKIRHFARLLKNAASSNVLANVDEFDEMLSVLDALSFRELEVLAILDRFETDHPLIRERHGHDEHIEDRYDRSTRFWEKFQEEVHQKFGMDRDELGSLLWGIVRTGCYWASTGPIGGNPHGRGYLTEVWVKLKKLIAPSAPSTNSL